MATAYTQTQDGPASDLNTFGGVGIPTGADDTVDMAGYDLEWDLPLGLGLGNITANGGTLWHPIDQDDGILFNATGVLAIGTGKHITGSDAATPAELPAAYALNVHWPQGASARDVYTCNNPDNIDIRGDSTYMPAANKYGVMDSTFSAGDTFYVTGDFTSKWAAGQTVVLTKFTTYASYLTDTDTYIISSVEAYDSGNVRTPIVLTVSPGLTYTVGGPVVNISRNIFFGDPASPTAIGTPYTENIRSSLVQGSTSHNIKFSDMIFRGWNRALVAATNLMASNIVVLNCGVGVFNSNGVSLEGDFVGCGTGIDFIRNGKYSGKIVASNVAISQPQNPIIFIGDFLGCNFAHLASSGTTHIGNIYSCNITMQNSLRLLIKSTSLLNNTTLANQSSGFKYSGVLSNCDVAGEFRNYRAYLNSADILPLQSGDGDFETPESGIPEIYKIATNSNCAVGYAAQAELDPLNEMAAWVEAGSKTLTMKIWPVGFSSPLDQDDIYLTATYLDTVSGTSRTTVVTGAGTFANGAWRSLTVDVSPAQAGLVYFNLIMTKYEAGNYVLIDPVWSVT